MSTELHVSAYESHHQAYKYGTIKMKNVQLLAGLYIESVEVYVHVAVVQFSLKVFVTVDVTLTYISLCVIDD